LIYFIVAYAYPHLVQLLPRSRFAPWDLRLVYLDGKGILREALAECARRGFSISDLSINHDNDSRNGHHPHHVTVSLEVRGQGSVTELAAYLHELDGIVDVGAGDAAGLSY
jgi:putative Mg2+ transporter-C (MgtC) family protein